MVNNYININKTNNYLSPKERLNPSFELFSIDFGVLDSDAAIKKKCFS